MVSMDRRKCSQRPCRRPQKKDCIFYFYVKKVQKIDLYGTVDTVVCTLDSINHLTSPQDVQRTFDRVSLFLKSRRIFYL